MKPTGYVIYRGPSQLDGAPIVCIATMKTDNRKTGNMVQTWILRDDIGPVAASKAGADASICGDCKHRWALGGACYVNIGQGPRAVWEKYKRGAYPDASILYPHSYPLGTVGGLLGVQEVGRGRKVRLGAYGDPAAVPAHVWYSLIRHAWGHTGYTHQWRLPIAAALRALCMASVDDPAELDAARAMGWRTFRVRCENEALAPAEFECVSETRGTSCADCLACDGAAAGRPRQASVAIQVHGTLKVRFTRARAIAA